MFIRDCRVQLLITYPLNLKSQESLNSLPKNNEIIRKRRPINFTLEDLNESISEDEIWDKNPSCSERGKTRILPRRNASSKIRFDEDFDRVQQEYPDLPQDVPMIQVIVF